MKTLFKHLGLFLIFLQWCPPTSAVQVWVFDPPPAGWTDFHLTVTTPGFALSNLGLVLWADSDIGGKNNKKDAGEPVGFIVGTSTKTVTFPPSIEYTYDWNFPNASSPGSLLPDWWNVAVDITPSLPLGSKVTGYYTVSNSSLGGVIDGHTVPETPSTFLLLIPITLGLFALRIKLTRPHAA